MSFSFLVKNELCRMNVKEKCCLKAELAAIISIGGMISLGGGREEIRIITENAAFARRTYLLFKELVGISPGVKCKKNKKLKKHTSYLLSITGSESACKVMEELKVEEPKIQALDQDAGGNFASPCCRRAFLRGAFLAGGSISDPEKTYHLELTTRDFQLANDLKDVMKSYDLNAKMIKRKGYYLVYLKEGDHIVDFLNIIGAHSALLNMENIRILKDMRNNVNRLVNCETANLEKTVNASVRQIQNIEYIRDNMGFENLPKGLREIAELRLQYRDASLKEMGEMLNPPLGKSGVNHRLRCLEKIAKHGTNTSKKGKSGKKA